MEEIKNDVANENANAAEVGSSKDVSEKFNEVRAKAEAAPKQVANEKGVKEMAVAVAKQELLAAAEESIGVKETLEVVEFALGLSKALAEAKSNDGKIDLKDIGLLFPIAPLLIPAIDGVISVPKELGDLSEEELEVLLAKAAEVLGGEHNAKVVLKVKAAIKFAHAGYDLYKAFAK